jgi:hypothetical protein
MVDTAMLSVWGWPADHVWKGGAEFGLVKSQKEAVEVRNSVLGAANQRCETDIEAVRQGIKTSNFVAEQFSVTLCCSTAIHQLLPIVSQLLLKNHEESRHHLPISSRYFDAFA